MKHQLLFISLLLLCTSCIGQKEEVISGSFTFPGTGLSLRVPPGWATTTIPGNQFPLIFTEVDFGIKPNIQLEVYSQQDVATSVVESYLKKKKKIYPDYSIVEESSFSTSDGVLAGQRIKAKRVNTDKIPIIHFSYIFNKNKDVYILSATCAEPSLQRYQDVFERILTSVEIRR